MNHPCILHRTPITAANLTDDVVLCYVMLCYVMFILFIMCVTVYNKCVC